MHVCLDSLISLSTSDIHNHMRWAVGSILQGGLHTILRAPCIMPSASCSASQSQRSGSSAE